MNEKTVQTADIDRAVQKHEGRILAALDYIWKNPETGYREWKTHEYLRREFEELGYTVRPAGNIPGFTAEIDTGRPGPKLAIFGELDSVICAGHPDADPETGAVHACGHCAQTAALVGIAAALKEPGMLDGLSGTVLLAAVPAEELIEIEYRTQLRRDGVIRYFGGKTEFLYRGLLDGVDLAFMIHTTAADPFVGRVAAGSNGCVTKELCFTGRTTHAASPEKSINALYAANLFLNSVNALRETFPDESHIRVHPIITAGGDSVNAIPDTVKVESYVRGAVMDEIVAVNEKVNRAAAASAAAIGGNVQIRDMPGYWPRRNDGIFNDLFLEAMESCGVRGERIGWNAGCSDMGDMGSLMPAAHPYMGGAEGKGHGNDYRITAPESACIASAKVQLAAVRLLLRDGAARAKEIVETYEPVFRSPAEYFAYVDQIDRDLTAVTYGEDGTVTLRYQ